MSECHASQSIQLLERLPGQQEFVCYFKLPLDTAPSNHNSRNLCPNFKSCIPVESLPQTIQNAIYVTCRLGVDYIWVDALCIIQDPDTDWRKEAASMHTIYQNTVITTASVDCEGSSPGMQTRSALERSRRRRGENYWNCLTVNASEMAPHRISWSDDQDHREEDTLRSRQMLRNRSLNGDESQLLWRNTIEQYTARQLTLEKDRPVAISGFSSAFEK